jgi:hypothetical protein
VAYATVDDIKNKVPQLRISSTSRPTEAEAAALIEQYESRVNAALTTLGYEIPVVGKLSVQILRNMVCKAVIADVLESQAYGIRDPNELGAGRARAEYDNQMRALLDPKDPFELPDATKTDVQDKLGSIASSIVSDVDFGDPTVTRDQVF